MVHYFPKCYTIFWQSLLFSGTIVRHGTLFPDIVHYFPTKTATFFPHVPNPPAFPSPRNVSFPLFGTHPTPRRSELLADPQALPPRCSCRPHPTHALKMVHVSSDMVHYFPVQTSLFRHGIVLYFPTRYTIIRHETLLSDLVHNYPTNEISTPAATLWLSCAQQVAMNSPRVSTRIQNQHTCCKDGREGGRGRRGREREREGGRERRAGGE